MNDEIKEILECMEQSGSTTELVLLDYITNLQQENERLKEANKLLEENWKYYMMKCGKAIEYIQNNMQYDDNIEDNWVMTNDLLNIL